MPPVIQPGIKLQPGIFQPVFPGVQNKEAKEMVERMQKVLEQLQKELQGNGKQPFPNFQPGVKPLAPAFLPAQKEMQKELQKLMEKMMEQLQKEIPNLPPLPPPLPQFQPMQGGFFQNNAQPQVGKVQFKQVLKKPLQPVAQPQPAFQPIGGRTTRPFIRQNNNGQITVRDGATKPYPTSYAGAVRVAA